MKFKTKNGTIEVFIPASNVGKFRFKKRDSNLSFGETFSTRTELFDEKAYLEWQIGYDVIVREVQDGKAETRLDTESFLGANGKEKFPFELSELFCLAIEQGLIAKNDAKKLVEEISSYSALIDEKSISVENNFSATVLNGMPYKETCIRLPTFIMDQTPDGTQIEVAIKQQQYASGVQPMIYFCIPLTSFINSSKLSGRSSASGDELVYVIDKSNAENLSNLMRVFGMASERHKHDIVKIIKVILNRA